MTDAELRETTKPPEAAGAGQRLRHARETRQLSVEDVANALHLSARHIEALEHEDLNHLPDPSYICGYLRGYARYLDLPAEELLDHFPGISTYLAGVRSTVMPTKLVAPVEEAAPTAVNWSTPAMLVAAAVIMGWLVFQFGGLGKDGTPGTVPESPPVTPDNGPVAAVPPKPEAAAGTSEATVAQTAPAATNATAPATASAPTEPVPATAVQPATRAELTLEFNGDSWVEAQDAAGQRVLYELGKSGRTRNVSGQAPFRIILGAARNVSIRLNGDPVDMTRYRDRDLAAVRVGTAQDNR